MPSLEPPSDLREAVLRAARRLLVQQGYAALSMRRIAREVGCGASSIYSHFESKDALVHELIDEGFQRWYEVLRTVAQGGGTPLQRLERACREYIRFGLENPEFYEVMYLFHAEQLARYPKPLYRRSRRALELFTEVVRAGAPDRFRDREQAQVGASVAWALLHGVVSTLLARRLDARVDRTTYIEASVRAVLEGVRGTRPALARQDG